MKKRIFMLAVIAVLMLSSVGMAAATDHVFFKLTKLDGVSKDTSRDVTTISFDVTAAWEVASADDTPATTSSIKDFVAEGWFKNANLSKWILGGSSNTFTPTSFVVQTADTSTQVASGTDVGDPYFLMKPFNSGATVSAGSKGTFTFKVVAKGKLEYPDEDCQIKVSLYNSTDDSKILDSYTSGSTTVVEVDGAEVLDGIDPIDYDPRNPDSKKWNGLDPTFSNTINTGSYDIGKNKPKLGKVEKANLTFTPGTEKDLTIKMNGPIELVDVYIAGKDAVKLYGTASADKNTNIRLTSASIKAYKIPFRITSYDFKKTVAGSTAKDQQKNWKSAESTLTLSFNGSKMQYKGFPITISMSNSNTGSKPVAKAIKLNIGENFTTPSWAVEVYSNEVTADKATYDAWEYGKDGTTWKWEIQAPTSSGDAVISGDRLLTSADFDYWYRTKVKGFNVEYIEGYINGNRYILSTDNKLYEPKQITVGYERGFTYRKTLDKKDKPEAATWVNPGAKENEEKAGEIYSVYYASGDAPYAITLKPDPTSAKDQPKVKKFFVDPASIDVVQPVYDYLGNIKSHGYVEVYGSPQETTKESKLAMTLTAANPSTKKKGATKVTAIAKTFPVIDKTITATLTQAEMEKLDEEGVDAWVYYTDGISEEEKDGSFTYKRVAAKRVEAGKLPSVKFKAKGSKTISYKLGKYYVYDGEVEEEDEDFNAEMLANLKSLGLSFDEKKGAVTAIDKKALKTPTLNAAKDAFKSLDIVVTALNNVGYDHAWAHVAITGAKPKMSDKEAKATGTVKKGDTIKFKVMAGKTAAETLTDGSANVKVLPGDGAASALSDLGLALVTYDSMDVIVSKEVTVAAGTKLPAGFTSKDIVSGDSRAAAANESADRRYAATEMVIRSGDVWAKSADLSLKNYGILQVIDSGKLAGKSADKAANKGVSVNLILENLGATNKGKIKVVVASDVKDGGDPTVPVVVVATPTSSGALPAANRTVQVDANTHNNGSAPDADAEEFAEGTVTIGAPRTVADLTAEQQAFLAEKGYTVVAVLPEITADADGQYDFDVELDEEAPEGAKLIWIAFPKNAPAAEDDEIVDFYDEAGTPVEGVPASHKIIASPWLREAVTYEPVIAVEAE